MYREGLPVAGLPSLSGLREPAKEKRGRRKDKERKKNVSLLLGHQVTHFQVLSVNLFLR